MPFKNHIFTEMLFVLFCLFNKLYKFSTWESVVHGGKYAYRLKN